MNWVNIGSGSVLSPVRRQAITWTNAVWLSIRPLGIRSKFHWNLNQNTKPSIHENALENAVSEITAILPRWRWVKYLLVLPLLFRVISLELGLLYPVSSESTPTNMILHNTWTIKPMIIQRQQEAQLNMCSFFGAYCDMKKFCDAMWQHHSPLTSKLRVFFACCRSKGTVDSVETQLL